MNELSTEARAKEVHENAVGYFKVSEQYGYKFIMEVKKIRDEQYYKQLGFSSFDDYCNDAWGVDRKYMSERISMAENLNENEFVGYSRQLGHKKSLLLSRMPEKQRDEAASEGIPTDEGYKSVDEATQKEISQYKKDAEEAKKRAEQAEKNAQAEQSERKRLEEENEQLSNQEPKIVEKPVKDEKQINALQSEIDSYKNKLDKTEQEKERLQKRINSEQLAQDDFNKLKRNVEVLSEKRDSIQKDVEDIQKIYKLLDKVEEITKEGMAPFSYSAEFNRQKDNQEVKQLTESTLESVEKWCKDMRQVMNQNIVMEG